MNVTRIAVLAVAAIAAGAAALLVRSMLGGGTPEVEASAPQPQFDTVEILVAAERIEPGRVLTPETVRWEAWPEFALSPDFITKEVQPDLDAFVQRTVARSPLVAGEPITEAKIAHSDSATFMAATIAPGKRAIAIPISAESGAGGFILPNDRVDVILTRDSALEAQGEYESYTILLDVRVLAIDQTVRQQDDQEYVVADTATLELSPGQSEMISQAQALGTLSLALRGLGDQTIASDDGASLNRRGSRITVLRYGVARSAEPAFGGAGPRDLAGASGDVGASIAEGVANTRSTMGGLGR